MLINSLVARGCQVSRTNPLPVKVLQTVVICGMSLLSQVRLSVVFKFRAARFTFASETSSFIINSASWR